MKSHLGTDRPSDLIDKVENGMGASGHRLTPKQCEELWCWIEELEDEVIERRGWSNQHDDPADHQDENGEWVSK